MYREKKQISIFEEAKNFRGAELDSGNRWVKLSEMIPWEEIERKYKAAFSATRGRPAKLARIALGSHLIKEKFCLSDRETVELIGENPYLQFFLGMERFEPKAPFDASMMIWFRKRLTPEMIADVNEYVIRGDKKNDRNDADGGNGGASGPASGEGGAAETNKGTMIVDATCVPSDIRFPTDAALLAEAREMTEKIIDRLHRERGIGKKPRTYRRKARKEYLRFARNRNPRKSEIRKAIRKQLSYLRRNLLAIEKMGAAEPLPEALKARLAVIKSLYGQQSEMYAEKKHSVADRIVSLHSPWVRPIIRGKANAPVEFGAKVAISMVDGYAMVERLSWNAFNETTTLIDTIERYRAREGVYPERILADKIYRTRETLSYCKKHGIRMSGPKLGRPPADKNEYYKQCLLAKAEAGERNAIEGEFGTGKRRYNLNRLTARLQGSGETQIHLIFLSMNLWKKLRAFFAQFLEWIFLALKRPVIV